MNRFTKTQRKTHSYFVRVWALCPLKWTHTLTCRSLMTNRHVSVTNNVRACYKETESRHNVRKTRPRGSFGNEKSPTNWISWPRHVTWHLSPPASRLFPPFFNHNDSLIVNHLIAAHDRSYWYMEQKRQTEYGSVSATTTVNFRMTYAWSRVFSWSYEWNLQ
jgi:hypothetical protein